MRFFLIDAIVNWQRGVQATAIKNVALSEDFFDDHFPRMPIMPGVLILEGMAQLGGVLLEETVQAEYQIERKALMTTIGRTKFRQTIRPGAQLVYTAHDLHFNDLGGRVSVDAHAADKLVTSTQFTYILQAIDDPDLRRDRKRLLNLWLEAIHD